MKTTAIGIFVTLSASSMAQDWNPFDRVESRSASRPSMTYFEAIAKTAGMVTDSSARSLASRHGLDLLNLTWEDTGRYKNSSVGPNISDMTIQVAARDPRGGYLVTCMPVIRFPNFSDLTGDLDVRDFTLMVGNERGNRLQRVSLYDYLASPTSFMSRPNSWRGNDRTLISPRDEKVLVSAQACFLPIPKQGKATFNPVLFNYQSSKNNPAVLTILATREGTSMTIIDNTRDAFAAGSAWGQRLFHNQNGQRTSLTGQRLSDFRSQGNSASTSAESGLNMVLLIQVPLKYREAARQFAPGAYGGGGGAEMQDSASSKVNRSRSDVEAAVIGHGDIEGPFTEVDNLRIERDDRFPVRVTVQFYKATSNGVVDEGDMADIKRNIDRVYARAESVGSLVTSGETMRPTEYWGSKVQPRGWWENFWRRHEANTGDSRATAIAKLERLLGLTYMDRPVCELYIRDLLRKR